MMIPNINSPGILQNAWEDFRRTVLHPDAGDVQISECRKCFFAGAVAVMQANLTIAEVNLPDAVAAAILQSMWTECMEFAEGLPDNGGGGLTDQELKIKIN